MSTKIYTGYRIHPKDRTFDGIWKFMMSAMKRIRRMGEAKAERSVVFRAIRTFDTLKAGYTPDLGKEDGVFKSYPAKAHFGLALGLAAEEFNSKASEVKETNRRNPFYDVSFEAVILRGPTLASLENKSLNDLLVMTYTDDRELEDAWKRTNGVEYFGYWDNTDPDESCSEKEWAYREKAWSEALGGDFRDSPGKSGMTVQAIPAGWAPMMGMWGFELGKAKKIALELEKEMTLDDRAEAIANGRLVGLRVQKALKKIPKDDAGFTSKAIHELRLAEEWVKKHPGAVKNLASKIKSKLKTVSEMFSEIPNEFGDRHTR